MILEQGDMWSIFGKTEGIFMITTNPIIKKDNSVVMGRGIALQAKQRFSELPYDFARRLNELHPEIDQKNVGLIGNYAHVPIWYFMVKDHWANVADLKIIKASIFYAMYGFMCLKECRVDLNFPGIGNGGLDRNTVLPLLTELPDNFHIWEYK